MKRLADITADRLHREARAAERAATLPPGDYFADGHNVARWNGCTAEPVVKCESHWDACLVLLARSKS